jgi:predicted nucleotidyltransferase
MKTVTTAGTREQLTSLSTLVPALVITAERTNTGYVYVGDKSVSSTEYAVELDSGDSFRISAAELGWPYGKISMDTIWLDVSVSTDGVSVAWLDKVDD